MKNLKIIAVVTAVLITGSALAITGQRSAKPRYASAIPVVSDQIFDGKKIIKSESQWKRVLSPDAFYVLRKKGTERPYTGTLTDNKSDGIYACGACG